MKKTTVLAAIFGLLFASCKKTDPPTGVNDPVFSVNFSVDTLKTIVAGKDGIYLFTSYELNDNVFFSTNSFADTDCPEGDCPGNLTFEFRGRSEVDSAFSIGFFPYYLPDSIYQGQGFYQTQILWKGNIAYESEVLTLLGPSPVSYDTPDKAVSLVLPNLPQEIRLDAFESSGFGSSIVRKILPSDTDTFPTVNVHIVFSGGLFMLEAQADSNSPLAYSWNNGSVNKSITVDTASVQDLYSVTVTDEYGNTASASVINIFAGSAQDRNTASFQVEADPIPNPFQVGGVALQWIDGAGRAWRSDYRSQDVDSFFQVMASEEYEPNEKGDRTKKLQVRFFCRLSTRDGGAKFISGEGTVAMARP